MILESFTKDYYAELMSWIANEEELMQFGGPAFSFPLTEEQLALSLSDKNRYAFRAVEANTIGTIGYGEIYLTESSAWLGRIIIADKNNRGSGLGQQFVRLLTNYALLNFDKNKVELNVFDFNTAAIKCYEKAGFTLNPDKLNKREVNNKTWTAFNMWMDRATWVGK